MLPDHLLRLRLANHYLTNPRLTDPTQLVAHLGAVQSQDYAGAKWALGQRLLDATDSSLDRAFDAGAILRTHVLRPTWHFVAPADIRWLLRLTAPRVKASQVSNERKLGLDEALFAHTNAVIAHALRGGKHLTRAELAAALRRAGITIAIAIANGQALAHVVAHAEIDAVVCSGPRRGKQFTYALLEERVPPPPSSAPQDRDAALAELTRRYFASHGPATAHDFAWWSGLTVVDATRRLDANRSHLTHETVDGLTYWFAPLASPPPSKRSAVYLLPNYDEYTVAYRHRDLYYDPALKSGNPRDDVPFGNAIVAAGRVVGTWSRILARDTVTLQTRWFEPPTKTQERAVQTAAQRHAAFLSLRLELPS